MENNSGGFRGWLRLGPDGFDYVVDALAIYASTEIWVPTDDGSMVQVDSRSCRFASLLMDRSDFRHGAVVRWRAGSSVDDFTMRRNRSDSLDKGSLDTATAVTPSLFKVGSGRPSRHPRFCLMLEYSESGLRNLGNSRPDRPHWIQAVVNKEEIHWLFPLSDNQDPEIRCTAALAWSRSRPGIAAIGDELFDSVCEDAWASGQLSDKDDWLLASHTDQLIVEATDGDGPLLWLTYGRSESL